MDNINFDYSITSTSISILATAETTHGSVTSTLHWHRVSFIDNLPDFGDPTLDGYLENWYHRLSNTFRKGN